LIFYYEFYLLAIFYLIGDNYAFYIMAFGGKIFTKVYPFFFVLFFGFEVT